MSSIDSLLKEIRSRGWLVAVHNDYRLGGEFHTFWLFTSEDRAVKGEGRSDVEALAQVLEQIKEKAPSSATW